MRIDTFLTQSAERAPDSIAVIEPGRRITYGELDRRASSVADALAQSGVAPGDRVIIALRNSIEFVAAYFGVLRAGAIAVPLPNDPRNDRLPKVIQDCEPRACIVDAATWPSIDAATPPVPLPFLAGRTTGDVPDRALRLPALDLGGPAGLSPGFAPPPVDAEDLAAIIYTSGSTGAPRGVMLSHRNIAANTGAIVEYLQLTAADRVMVVLPFYYVYGLSLLHTHVAVGGALVIDNRFAFPNAVLQAMREHEVTGFAGVPSTFALLLHRSNIATSTFPSLRYVTQAGGAMAPARIHEWQTVMPRVPFFVMYGATEASARLTYLPPEQLTLRPGSIGRPLSNVELRVLRDDGRVAAPGEVGELVARGPNIARGYWRQPAATAERFGPDGYRTGDLGYADADGFFYVVGRRGDMLKVGAHRVSAVEIEEVLYEHPAVHETAVIGAPDDLLGEVPVAFVALREGSDITERELLAFARAHLPEHKVPARFELIGEIPKTPAGKLDKRALGAAFAGSAGVVADGRANGTFHEGRR